MRRFRQIAGLHLGQNRHQRKDDQPAQGHRTKDRVQHVDEDKEDRHEGQIEDRPRRLRPQKVAQRIDTAAALLRLGRGKAVARHVDRHAMRQGGQSAIQPRPDPHQNLARIVSKPPCTR
jgi:hypothetical protein